MFYGNEATGDGWFTENETLTPALRDAVRQLKENIAGTLQAFLDEHEPELKRKAARIE